MGKKHIKAWVFYGVMVLLFCVFTYILFLNVSSTDVVGNINESGLSHFELFKQSILDNLGEPIAMLLLQIIAILIVSRLFGLLFSKIGQPTVIGEILAGIILGPSLLGYFFPESFAFLFAPDSLGNLYILSQIGLILFMFTIGMELNLNQLKEKISETFVISHASILIPYFLGMLLAYFVYDEFASHTDFLSFALFIGISMSITAFPVLARIIQEKGLTKTHLGTIAIASAANDDVTAWCLLAVVIAIAKTGTFLSALYTIALAIGYVLFMLFVMRPFLKRIGEIYKNTEVLNISVVAFFLLVLIISSFVTQLIGIHALFGAFLAGVIMPPAFSFRKMMIEKIEDVSVTLFLPLFFVYTGLRTEIGLLNTPYLWTVCGIFILVAVAGKFLGGALSARVLGESWRDSLSLGTLMNTRGLMELIVLNIGYEMGILPPTIFVMLVIMALVTTFMTTPFLSLINRLFPEKKIEEERIRQEKEGIFKALIALGNPVNGKILLNVAKTVLDGAKNSLDVTVLHITAGTDVNPLYGEQFSTESFAEIKQEAEAINIPIHTDYQVSDTIEVSIARTVNVNNFDFLLVGAGLQFQEKPFFKKNRVFKNIDWLNETFDNLFRNKAIFFPGTLIKDKTRFFIENSNCSVGIFVNRNFISITSVFIMIQSSEDAFLVRYARRLIRNDKKINVTIYDPSNIESISEEMADGMRNLKEQFPNSIKLIRNSNYNPAKYSFMLISYPTWNLMAEEDDHLQRIPSTLIINKKPSRFSTRKPKQLPDSDPLSEEI